MRRAAFVLLPFVWLVTSGSAAPSYDLVLTGGRVIDPETGLDAVRNVVLFKARTPAALQRMPWRGDKTVQYASGPARLLRFERRQVGIGAHTWDRLTAWSLELAPAGRVATPFAWQTAWHSSADVERGRRMVMGA